ncbi:MAG TPA: HU family DNA-binding protein [Candidatus Kapabacteria bacterium]|jgi:DNA-binding protein HU-beta|nr:HU family DNA-binding protein [Candidatus Kapabacteria bacterium]HOV93034.1 HU family DNA-binding protein [Candidatus Kapabacteria bacterium]
MALNKSDLVNVVAESAELKKVEAEKAVKATFEAITNELKNHGTVTLVGFGTFTVSHRKARPGRNPRNQQTIEIPSKIVPRFKPGKTLKEAVDVKPAKKTTSKKK